MIDNNILHYTPEGTTLALTPAGIIPRMQAWLLDFIIRAAIVALLSFVLSFLGQAGGGLILILYFVVDWFYAVLFEVYRDGQTIGKKSFNIKVCQDDGIAIGWQASMIRNILRIADFLPMMFVGGALCMLFNSQSKRLGDLVAGTVVVYTQGDKQDFDIPIKPIATPKIPLLFDEQQAILAFAERQDELSVDRQMELAKILTPLTHHTNPLKVNDELVGFANGIVGRDDNANTNNNNNNNNHDNGKRHRGRV